MVIYQEGPGLAIYKANLAFEEIFADEMVIGHVPPAVLQVNVTLTGSPRLRNEGGSFS